MKPAKNEPKALLVLSMGTKPHLAAEAVGLFNRRQYPFYATHSDFDSINEEAGQFLEIGELHLICTQTSYQAVRDPLHKWIQRHKLQIEVFYHYPRGIEEMKGNHELRAMRNLVFSLIHGLRQKGMPLYLSLTGGRKTMSSDVQQAATLFGYDALIHILAEGQISFDLLADPRKLDGETVSKITPAVYSAHYTEGSMIYLQAVGEELYPHCEKKGNALCYDDEDTRFLDEIETQQRRSEYLAYHFYLGTTRAEIISNFRALQTLPPKRVEQLKSTRIKGKGDDQRWLRFLQRMPKTDLHSHLGGYANPEEILEITQANQSYIKELSDNNHLNKLCLEAREAIKHSNADALRTLYLQISKEAREFRQDAMLCFLYEFGTHTNLLKEVLYGELAEERRFIGIGLESYEKLGDAQGSSLLHTEASLRQIAQQIKANARRHNLIYQELRCSPCNYTRWLSGHEVVRILHSELEGDDCLFKLIIIGSRHREPRQLREHIRLCLDLTESGGELADFICGFDLAGSEEADGLEKLRAEIAPLFERCVRISIHTGETTDERAIWRSVYHLNADRIGHGLYLLDFPDLLLKLRDAKTGIELCPSSNYQVNGYKDFQCPESSSYKEYPLARYIEQGLKVSLNTDDQGISLTDISNEYLKACRMSPSGLSLWQLLGIVRNGFTTSFADHELKKRLLLKAEKMIMEALMEAFG